MSEFRPMLLPLRLAASFAVILALDAAIAFAAAPADPPKHTPAKIEAPAGYIWSATRIGSGLRLRGTVPSEEIRRTLIGMVKAHFPDLAVVDRLKISAAGVPPQEQWLGAVSFGLKQLSRLQRGSVRLLNVELKLDGEARSAADYVEVKKALAGSLPTGLTITADTVRPPTADPFVFVADLGTNTLSLSGSVPNEAARKQLRDLSRRLFERPGLDDRLELASGAPKDWNDAVAAALRALSRLESREDRDVGSRSDDRRRGARQGNGGCDLLSASARPAGDLLDLREYQLEGSGNAAHHRRQGCLARQIRRPSALSRLRQRTRRSLRPSRAP